MHYYNEWETFAAQWLSNLVEAGHIPHGTVDTRSITEIDAEELRGYTQCHFFAGIAGWAEALRLAGWPADREVWTGSCPCQPFSTAGKRKGTADERHLWPEFFRLIRECRPATVFGEQVASKAGREWLDGVFADLESVGYAVAGADLCAAGVGAPHIRQRLFWVADSNCDRWRETRYRDSEDRSSELKRGNSDNSGLADTEGTTPRPSYYFCSWESDACNGSKSDSVRLGDTVHQGLEGHREPDQFHAQEGREAEERYGPASVQWSDFDIVRCVEPTKEPGRYVEKRRRVESGTLPLAHGVSSRVGRLRAYGNAIVPSLAALFVNSYMDVPHG